MERSCMSKGENIYFACRKRAAEYNPQLSSRERASELLGISTSTLANHELGITKNVPVDTVVMMADLYHAPELRNIYCKVDCPIGKRLPIATECAGLESITIKILNCLDNKTVKETKKILLGIAEDGEIREERRQDFERVMELMDKLSEEISGLRMLAELYGGKKNG